MACPDDAKGLGQIAILTTMSVIPTEEPQRQGGTCSCLSAVLFAFSVAGCRFLTGTALAAPQMLQNDRGLALRNDSGLPNEVPQQPDRTPNQGHTSLENEGCAHATGTR